MNEWQYHPYLHVSTMFKDVNSFIAPVKIADCIAENKWEKKPCFQEALLSLGRTY